jgi:hypothetical protein
VRSGAGLSLWLALSVPCLLGAEAPISNLERGRELFAGELPLTARMVGHSDPLPQDAVRCRNCHSKQPALVADAAQDFAPQLNARSLLTPLPRRGGPPSKYDLKALCRVLRDGIDPAHVMIQQAMPRYTMSDGECEALWTYLTFP